MSFSVEYLPNREEVLKESDEKCREQAAILSTVGWLFVDPEFFPDAKSLGNKPEEKITEKNKDYENVNDPWFPPHQLMTSWSRTDGNKWQVWDDPWPFHVCQGDTGDCWLMAALMTIARRKELLEQIIPKRHYTLKHGIVQVRLFVDGKWQMITTDFHIPQQNGIERFSQLSGNQTWVAFIEKAFAKLKGSYGNLWGGHPKDAYRFLTGAHSRYIPLKRDLDIDGLWEELVKYHSSGFLLAAATPLVLEEEKLRKVFYNYYSVNSNHAYSILDFKKYGMHRLIQLGNTNSVRWNGKWSEMANYNDATSKKFSELDRTLSNAKVFWMSIEDFVRFFDYIHVCEYQEGWTDYQFKQKISRASRHDGLIIRLNIEKPTDVNIEAHVEIESGENQVFLNIHRANNENQCGELIKSVYNQESTLTMGGLTLVPGTYFVVMVFCEIVPKLDVNWMIKSSSPLSYHFVSCPFSLFVDSLQQVIMKNGETDEEDENITIFLLDRGGGVYIMAENRMNYGYFEIQGNLKNADAYKSKSKNFFNEPMFLAPMTRRIVGMIQVNGDLDSHLDKSYYDYDYNYSVLFRVWKLYESVKAESEEMYEPIRVKKDLNQSEA
ncbi:hypothetical protein GCK72_020385 [Caenorhabditis remanei]|uniref:Calpain catalytic domain-containing protein n=1 Tax=Caenorhabditis remanei TaxID=31234 RepID=A0A6A5GF51_CAERE|nr:hypothetical protein GCK72_020385 [Caenorhabditis remanei]KAF1753828.1 hypothetical protein GCK72_020385 [Caenorhabditis remanei]